MNEPTFTPPFSGHDDNSEIFFLPCVLFLLSDVLFLSELLWILSISILKLQSPRKVHECSALRYAIVKIITPRLKSKHLVSLFRLYQSFLKSQKVKTSTVSLRAVIYKQDAVLRNGGTGTQTDVSRAARLFRVPWSANDSGRVRSCGTTQTRALAVRSNSLSLCLGQKLVGHTRTLVFSEWMWCGKTKESIDLYVHPRPRPTFTNFTENGHDGSPQ